MLKMCIRDRMYISLNDFYYEIGLDNIKLGDELGWNIDDGYIDLSLIHILQRIKRTVQKL